MNCSAYVTGAYTMMNCSGNCSDNTACSCGGNSSASSTTSLDSDANDSLLRSTPELQNICLKYSQSGSALGSCAAIRLTRGLTVKATSTCSSTEASEPQAHNPP